MAGCLAISVGQFGLLTKGVWNSSLSQICLSAISCLMFPFWKISNYKEIYLISQLSCLNIVISVFKNIWKYLLHWFRGSLLKMGFVALKQVSSTSSQVFTIALDFYLISDTCFFKFHFMQLRIMILLAKNF